MILTRSPYYKYIPWLRPSDGEKVDSYKLQLYVWTGGKLSDAPAVPNYTITKDNVEDLSGEDKVDIARLIEDFIENTVINTSVTGVQDGNCSVWVKHNVEYDFGGNISTELEVTEFATKGYGYGYEGENYTSPMVLLTDSIEIDADRKSNVYLPINRDLVTKDIIVISFPSNNLRNTYTLNGTLESNEIVSILSIVCKDAGTDEYIQVIHGDETFSIFLRDECKQTPQEVQFINRYGASQTLTFFKERKDSLSVKGSQYESSNGQPIFGNHQFKKFNVNGTSEVSLSTGYIEEGSNNLVKELILSETVWLNGLPVNCSTENVEFKNRVNDRVVNYTIKFSNAYNEINTI